MKNLAEPERSTYEGAEAREELPREVKKLRSAHPWVERVSVAGWLLLLAILILRAAGAG